MYERGGGDVINDLVPVVKEFPDRQDINIFAVSDLHVGSAEWQEQAWVHFRQAILADPNTYVIVAGDMMNNGTKSNVTNVYEETMRPREQKARLVEELTPIRDRIICGVPGNHEMRNVKDVDNDPLYDVFCKLDLEDIYRTNGCFPILRFGKKSNNGIKNPTYKVAVFHGAGSGALLGGYVNKIDRFGMAIDGVDLMIVGHTHKPITWPTGKLVIDPYNGKVSVKPFRVVVSTSWLSYGGYVMRKLLTPSVFCQTAITLHGDHKAITVSQTT